MLTFRSTLLWSSGYSKLTWSNRMAPGPGCRGTAPGASWMSMGVSRISKKRSMPVMPRWNCSANSTMRRMVAIRVDTYSE